MSDTKLGVILVGEHSRDAIHIAVTPVTCRHGVAHGAHVGLVQGKTDEVEFSAKPVGIVDPFLHEAVPVGVKFWLVLYPQTITASSSKCLGHH